MLKYHKHKNRRLQKDYDRFGGRDAFDIYKVCKAANKEIAYKFEQMLIDGCENPYNILIAGGAAGRVYIPSTIQKMSQVAKGRVITEEQRAKISKTKRGVEMSAENKRKISEALIAKYAKVREVPYAKLREADVYEIHRLRKQGALINEIGKKFNVSAGAIGKIIHGRTWKIIYRELNPLKITEKGAI